MAYKMNGATKWVGLVIVLLGMFAGGVRTATVMSKDIQINSKHIEEFKDEYTHDMDCLADDIKEIKSDIKMLLQRK